MEERKDFIINLTGSILVTSRETFCKGILERRLLNALLLYCITPIKVCYYNLT